MNKVILIGNVGKDPESRVFENGNTMVKFSLATSESWKDKEGNKRQLTEWHDIVCYGKQAETIARFVKAGQKLGIEGRISSRTTDEGRKYTNIKLDSFEFVGGQSVQSGNQSKPQVNATPAKQDEAIDDLPF